MEGDHSAVRSKVEVQEIRGHLIAIAPCKCGGDDHHWLVRSSENAISVTPQYILVEHT